MKRSRFTEEQIIGILKEQEAGAKTADVCRKHGISEATFYKYKAKYGGMDVSDARIAGPADAALGNPSNPVYGAPEVGALISSLRELDITLTSDDLIMGLPESWTKVTFV